MAFGRPQSMIMQEPIKHTRGNTASTRLEDNFFMNNEFAYITFESIQGVSISVSALFGYQATNLPQTTFVTAVEPND